MSQALPGFPQSPQHLIEVSLAGVRYQARYTWRQRSSAWYLDLLTIDGDELVVGRRMSAGWTPYIGLRIDGLPGGTMFIRGVDGYERVDLGDSLRAVQYGVGEIAPAAAPDIGLIIVVP